MREDRLLIRRLRLGDQAALHRIYEKYKDNLLTVATCLLGDLAAAEDCLHDVFVGLAAAATGFPVRNNLKGYLIACIANRACDRLRRQSRQVSLADIDDIVDRLPDPAEPFAQQLMDREEAARLYDALAKLPYDQREVIGLHLSGHMTFREIATRQGVSINTVQSRYRYGLDKLRALLRAREKV